jgi:gamma-glutamylcyclotransferase (GGCT)/AIG2-like uncharacterized protein YtfP
MDTQAASPLLQVASQFVQFLGWPALIIGAWKLRSFVYETKEEFATQLDKIADNHLNHIHQELQSSAQAAQANATAATNLATAVVSELRELRQDIRESRK